MTRLNTNMRTMYGPGEQERQRLLASQQGLLTEHSPKQNSFDPQVFQHAAEIAQKNLAMQEEARQADMQRQMQMQQLQMQERQANARGTLDHQRFKAGDRNDQQRLQLADRDSQQRFGLAKLQESKRMGDQEQLDAQWQHQTALVLDKDMSEMLKVARTIDYTPEGRRIYAQLAAEGRAVQSAKGKVRPAQWSQMAGQFMERFEQADLGSYQSEPPSIKDVMARQYQDMGNGVGLLMDSKGDLKSFNTIAGKDMAALAPLTEDGTPKPITTDEYMNKQFNDPAKGPAAIEKAKKEAIAELQKQWNMKPGNEEDMPPMPEPSEILEQMRRDAEFNVQVQNMSRGIAPPPEEQPIASTQPGKAMSDHIRAKKEGLETGEPQPDPTQGPNYGQVEKQGFFSALGDRFGEMAGAFKKPAADPNEESRNPFEEAKQAEAVYYDNPRHAAIKELFDEKLTEGYNDENDKPKSNRPLDVIEWQNRKKTGGTPFQRLDAAVKEAKLPRHPSRYINTMALDLLAEAGSEDPVGDAAGAVADAIRKGTTHFSLKAPWEQEALASIAPVYDLKKDQDKIKELAPGKWYMDKFLNMYRIPPEDKTIMQKTRAKRGNPTGFPTMPLPRF